MGESFETMLTGGHPNSLGRTVEVVDLVLSNRSRLADLYQTYFTQDEVVRLRVSSAMKRVTIAEPEWVMDYMDGLQNEIAVIDQASTQWTLALIFDILKLRLSAAQHDRAVEIMKHNLVENSDWIVLNNSMQVLFEWSENNAELRKWLIPHLQHLTKETRKSVASRATKLLAKSV